MFDLGPDCDKAAITYGERSLCGVDYFELGTERGVS